jgi:peptidylprolyl isomerase
MPEIEEGFKGVKVIKSVDQKGPKPYVSSSVTVHYVLRLTDGKLIDSSRERREPFSFTLGGGEVIQGWEDALV